MSNGYPSGPHFNLNIHGKKPSFTCPAPDPLDGYGSSVFIPEYQSDYPSGPATTIEYVASKKHDSDGLNVIDACSAQFDGDAARVQIPKTGIYSEGFWVFARVRAKPNNSKDDGEPSNIILTPDPVLRVCNDGEVDFDGDGTLDDCPAPDSDLMPLGLVTNQGAYKMTSAGLERFDSSPTKGRGKATATDFTGLFTWTGYTCPVTLDINGDGVIDEADVPNDLDGDLDIDADDLAIYLSTSCEFHNSEWVFNVADLVVQDQDVNNDGVKLLKLRFYPVATTEFTPTTPSIVAEIHDAGTGSVVTGGTIDVPASIYASASISAGTGPIPQGTADFTFYENGTCEGAGILAGSSFIDSSGFVQSTTKADLSAGAYSFQAHYNGDDPSGFYLEADSSCVAVAVGETPSVSIEIHDSAEVPVTSVVEGTTVHPQATVSGSGTTPTGTVTFMWFANGDCTPLPADTSAATGLDSGGVVDATGFTQTPTQGTYAYKALYNGDGNYLPASSQCAALTVTAPEIAP
jgi:hypothetical protein